MLELIQQFSPLLRKYAYLLQTEDSFYDLQADFIELIMTIKLESLRSHHDGALVNYINSVVRNKYILRSKQKQKDAQMLRWDDFNEMVQREYEPRCPLFNAEQEFFQQVPASILSTTERNIISMVYLHGYSVAEIAKAKGITRQAVNQIKLRALKKMSQEITRNEV